MAAKKSGLGRGFDSLLLDNATESAENTSVVTLKLSEIEPNKQQARKQFDEETISELAASIEEHGILQPLLVRPLISGGYQLVAGERRWRAARTVGLSEIPVIIKALSNEEATIISLIENLQRENLNPVEEAYGFQDLINTYGLTQEDVAKKVGKSRTAVTNTLRILKLPEKVIEFVRQGKLSAGHAKALAGMENDALILTATEIIINKGLSVRETEKLVKNFGREKKKAEHLKQKRNSFFDEVELALSNSLGRKAKVVTKGNGDCGSLVIDFYDKEDLELIAKALSALEE